MKTMRRSAEPAPWAVGLLVIAAVMAVWWHAYQLVRLLACSPGVDFAHWYVNATLMRQHVNFVTLYAGPSAEQARLLALAKQWTGGVFYAEQLTFSYPPSAFVWCVPLTWLPYTLAYRVWVMFSALCGWGSVLACGRWLLPAPPRGPVVWCSAILLTAFYHPMLYEFETGQTMCVILLCHVAALILLQRHRGEWAAGVWLALGALLKVPFHGLWIVCLLWRRWRACVSGLVVICVVEALTWRWVGRAVYHDYFAVRATDVRLGGLYQSVFSSSWPSLVVRLLDVPHHATWRLPALGIIAIAALALIGWAGRLLWRHRTDPTLPWVPAYGVWVGGILLLMPRTHEYHLLVLLVPLIWIWLAIVQRPDALRLVPRFLLAYGLVAAPYATSRWTLLQSGWPALLTAGRTIGMLATIGWCRWMLGHQGDG